MTCDRCGQPTPLKVCAECTRSELAEKMYAAGDLEETESDPICAECREPAPNGAYSDERPGVWLCPDHLNEEADREEGVPA